jgi:hypothetical protein
MQIEEKLTAVFAVIAHTAQAPGDALLVVSGVSGYEKCATGSRKYPKFLIFAERALDCRAHAN